MSFGLSGPEGIHPLLHARAPPLLVNNRYLTIIFCLWTLCEMDRAHPSAHCCRKCCFPLVELPSHMFCGKPVPVWSSDQKVWLKYKNFNPTPSLAVKKLLRTRVIATWSITNPAWSNGIPTQQRSAFLLVWRLLHAFFLPSNFLYHGLFPVRCSAQRAGRGG